MAKFRKKPVVVEAFQWTVGVVFRDMPSWLRAGVNAKSVYMVKDDPWHLFISTLEGVVRASPGDWIIRGVNGELYPCKPDVFTKTYEPVRNDNRASKV